MDLVERDASLRQLQDCLRKVTGGSGHVALIAGEAGIGKTTLLRALASQRTDVTLWWRGCDALQTPHPLAPLYDIARSKKTGLEDLLAAACDRIVLFEAVLAALARGPQPVLLVTRMCTGRMRRRWICSSFSAAASSTPRVCLPSRSVTTKSERRIRCDGWWANCRTAQSRASSFPG